MPKKIIVPNTNLPPKPAAVLFNVSLQSKYLIILALGFLLYANTLVNGFALDDNGVILGNQYVQEGLGGLKKIFTSDAYSSFLEQMHANQHLAGGRYRPLSIAVFAVVHQFFGDSKFILHLINVACFLTLIGAIFYFLSHFLFKKLPYGEDMAFFATILFTIHPIHTEVVANIKSLDEILSLLFVTGTFIFSQLYLEKPIKKYLLIGLLCFFLALFAKEYAMALVALLPILVYVNPAGLNSGNVIRGRTQETASLWSGRTMSMLLYYYGVFILYMFIRIGVVGLPHTDENVKLLNNLLRVDPYYYATPAQKFATECFVLGKYLVMLFFPYPLASDYSYNQIPYHNFSSIWVWLSILIYGGISFWGLAMLKKKNLLAFPVFFYLFNLLLISNIFMNVGAPLCERFAFESSLGFVVLFSYFTFYLMRKLDIKLKRTLVTVLTVLFVIAGGAETIDRNSDWKDDATLFTTDVYTVPNSAFALCNASACYINIAQEPQNEGHGRNFLDTARNLARKAMELDHTFPDPVINLGLSLYCLGYPDSAMYYWNIVQNTLYPNHPGVLKYFGMLGRFYLKQGKEYGENGDLMDALSDFRKGVRADSANAEIWYNLGGAYFSVQKFDSARKAWTIALQLKPGYPEAINGMNALPGK